jgi:MarR family transcriptional regulator, organic hydroperoxide resistance regulator
MVPYGQPMNERWIEADPKRMPLGRLLAWTGQSVTDYYRRTVQAHGALSATALGVLGVLADEDPLAPSHRTLAGRLGINPATLTPVIDALVEEDSVDRQRDPEDRRVVRLRITRSGRQRLWSTLDAVGATLKDRIPDPRPDEERIIRAYLLAVLAAVDARDMS